MIGDAHRDRWYACWVNAGLIALSVFSLSPLLWMVSVSFMGSGQASQYPPPMFPTAPTLAHYRQLLTSGIGHYLLNSFVVASVITLGSLILNTLAGYAFAKLEFPGRSSLFQTLLMALVVPAQVTMMPLFLFMKQLHLVNSLIGIVLPSLASVFGIFLIRQFARSLPDALLDAARLDGASEWRIFVQIVVPLLKPILVTLSIFSFMTAWNDFMWPLILLTDQTHATLPVALASLSREHVMDTELMMAGAVVTTVPVLALFILLQRYYVGGLLLGSVKE